MRNEIDKIVDNILKYMEAYNIKPQQLTKMTTLTLGEVESVLSHSHYDIIEIRQICTALGYPIKEFKREQLLIINKQAEINEIIFANRLRALREHAGLSRETLANVLRLHPSTIGKYERTNLLETFIILIDIANYFNVSTDYLLGLTDRPNHLL